MTRPDVRAILAQLNSERSYVSNNLISKDFVSFPGDQLEGFFADGLGFGEVSEWGMRPGSGGREVLLQLLSSLTEQGLWTLWIRPQGELEAYPPAWRARGVNLRRLRFAYTNQAVADLKPIFMDGFFKVIVIDEPSQLSEEDCAFLARRAKEQKQMIIITRPFFLSQKRGNVWVKLRVNIWRSDFAKQLCIQVIKGLSPRQININLA